MQSDGERQPRAKPKKRRRIVVSETDSSDECDSPTVKTQRKQRISKLTNEIKKIATDKVGGELEAAGSSQNVKFDEKIERQANDKISSENADAELARNATNSKSSESLTAPKQLADDKETPAASTKIDDRVERNDGESVDQCPICWAPFASQEVAIPSCCNHCFCVQCIIEWSKNTNTCPVDRLPFNKIEVRQNFGGKATRYMPIETRHQQDDDDIEDDVYGSWEHNERNYSESDSGGGWNSMGEDTEEDSPDDPEQSTDSSFEHPARGYLTDEDSYGGRLSISTNDDANDEEEEDEDNDERHTSSSRDDDDDNDDDDGGQRDSSNNGDPEEETNAFSPENDDAPESSSSFDYHNDESSPNVENDFPIADDDSPLTDENYSFSDYAQEDHDRDSSLSPWSNQSEQTPLDSNSSRSVFSYDCSNSSMSSNW